MPIQKKHLALFLSVLAGTSLHAQHGCYHSPEAPTAALMLVGSVGISLGSTLLSRLAGKRRR